MTTIGAGIGSQVGFALESPGAYGTYVAPAKFAFVTKSDLKKVKTITQGNALTAGNFMQWASHRQITTRGGKGTLDMDVLNKGMGLWLECLMGTTVTPLQQGATAAYLQTHTLADNAGKSLTVQVGVPDASGTVNPYTFLGCKVSAASFTFELAKAITSQWTIVARDVVETQTLVAASYAAGTRPFVGTDTTIKVGAYGAETSVSGVKKATIKIERTLKEDAYYFGGLGLKAEPKINGYDKLSGTLEVDFVDKSVFADRFASDTGFSLVLEAVGPLIASTYYETFRITLPGCYLDGDTPVVDGPGIVSGNFPFTCLYDGTHLPKIEVISTDVTL